MSNNGDLYLTRMEFARRAKGEASKPSELNKGHYCSLNTILYLQQTRNFNSNNIIFDIFLYATYCFDI